MPEDQESQEYRENVVSKLNYTEELNNSYEKINYSKEHIFDEEKWDNLWKVIDELWLWDLLNRNIDLKNDFTWALKQNNINFETWDTFKLEIKGWDPVLYINRWDTNLCEFHLAKAMKYNNTQAIDIVNASTRLDLGKFRDNLSVNVNSEYKLPWVDEKGNPEYKNKWDNQKRLIVYESTINPVQWQINKGVWEDFKLLKDLNLPESIKLLKDVFWEWPWTDLLIKIDDGSTFAIKRMIALGKHEWELRFGCQNKDPKSWQNIWTFQIWWAKSTKESSLNKYLNCIDVWVNLAESFWINIDYKALVDNPAQRDLIAHMWFIKWKPWYNSIIEDLKNPNLSKEKLIYLMSTRIQVWIQAVWIKVNNIVNTTKINTESLAGNETGGDWDKNV